MKKIIFVALVCSVSSVFCQSTSKEKNSSYQVSSMSIEQIEVLTDDASPFTDDYIFKSKKIEKIKEIVSVINAAQRMGDDAVLTKKQIRLYDSLVDSDKLNIDIILMVRMQKMRYSIASTRRCQDTL